jgi:hypothetical protein
MRAFIMRRREIRADKKALEDFIARYNAKPYWVWKAEAEERDREFYSESR